MLDTELDNQESLNPEGDQDTNLESETDDTQDEAKKAKEYGENQKIRAEKAEKEIKDLKAKLEKETPKNVDKKEQSSEPNHSKRIDKLFLKSEGLEHDDDIKFVTETAERLKLPVDEVIKDKYVKSQLKDFKDQREAQDGAPKGKGKSGGTGQHDVDYHLAKGTTPADVETAVKVIDARMDKETNANKFSEELFRG